MHKICTAIVGVTKRLTAVESVLHEAGPTVERYGPYKHPGAESYISAFCLSIAVGSGVRLDSPTTENLCGSPTT
jgi:hypothetical protein